MQKTARKGRRSKSRDALEDTDKKSQASTSKLGSPTTNKEISIDITLDLQNSSHRDSNASGAAETRRPTGLRRISGGWADTGGFKSGK